MDQVEQKLFQVTNLLGVADVPAAQELLQEVMSVISQDTEKYLKHMIFASALIQRAQRQQDNSIEHQPDLLANLYLKQFDVPQIELFNLLATKVPQVSLTTTVSNHLITKACTSVLDDTDELHILDVGIGSGRQIVAVLQHLAKENRLPQKVVITGIEPAKQSLEHAEQSIKTIANQLKLNLDFVGINSTIEDMTEVQWKSMSVHCREPIVIASFALHHIMHVDGRDIRTSVLARIRLLTPALIVLAEPNVHHLESDFEVRFKNCWHHFGQTFEVIDQLDIDQHHKQALKASFFGREIHDILGESDERRVERHEATESWLGRLKMAGYEPLILSLDDFPKHEESAQDIISITPHQGYIGLDFGHETLWNQK